MEKPEVYSHLPNGDARIPVDLLGRNHVWPPEIDCVLMHQDAREPTWGSDGAAAMDLYAAEPGVILRGTRKIVETGVAMAIPRGWVGEVCTRSGLAANMSLQVLNAPGLIDSDYRGTIKIILFNHGNDFGFHVGDRLAQLKFTKHERPRLRMVTQLPSTVRGVGGLGSTGVSN